MANNITLTNDEKEAKNVFLKMYSAYGVPIDSGSLSDLKSSIPAWFNEEKYKRGQKYYHDNSAGISQAVIVGLICTLADPGILDVLHSTGKSSTPDTARLRYVETILHQKTWYDYELNQNSRSWKSLNKVRRLHLIHNTKSLKTGTGIISQTEIAMTLFVFMGLTIARPTHFNIPDENTADREGFIHFWAVMGHVIGLKDEYNYCLLSLDVCRLVCDIIIRYVCLPLLQFEPPLFKQMASAAVDGLGGLSPIFTYDSFLYLSKRSCSITGYQYRIDISKENLIKDVFTKDEIQTLRSYVFRCEHAVKDSIRFFPERIHIVEIVKDNNNLTSPIYDEEEQRYNNHIEAYRKELGLEKDDKFVIKTIEHEHYQLQLSDTKFQTLPFRVKMSIRLKVFLFWINDNYVGSFLNRFLIKNLEKKFQNYLMANSKSSLY